MKKILLAAVASTAFVASPAFAQSNTDSQDLTVSGTVQDECSIENPGDVTFTKILINEGAGSDALLLKNGQPASDTQNIWVSCNYAAKLTASSNSDGLINGPGAALINANNSDDFTNKIDYRIELSATDGSFPTLDFRTRTGPSPASVNAPGAFHDDAKLFVYIDRDDTQKRPVAGTYTDTAVLTLGPV